MNKKIFLPIIFVCITIVFIFAFIKYDKLYFAKLFYSIYKPKLNVYSENVKEGFTNVVLITDKSYAFPANIVIRSLIKNKNPETKYNIFVVAIDFDKDTIKKTEELAEPGTNVIVLKQKQKYYNYFFRTSYMTATDLYKFDLPCIFPNIDKIIYVDSDFIIRTDLSDLYNMDLSDKYLAAVKDFHTDEWDWGEYIGIPTYFNAGFMLLNLKKMREDNIPQKLLEYKLNNLNNERGLMTQDALNKVTYPYTTYINPKYNLLSAYVTDGKATLEDMCNYYQFDAKECDDYLQNANIHYCGHKKPWNSEDVVYLNEWLEYLNDNEKEQINNTIKNEQ